MTGHRPPASSDTVLPCIGVVCLDPLRLLGLQILLGHGVSCHVGVLEGTRAADLAGLELVLIDSTATGHLLPLIEAFRRIRPQIRLLILGSEAGDAPAEAVIGAGAQGYLCHTSSEAALRYAVSVIRDGSIWAPRRVLARLLERARAGIPVPSGEIAQPPLTPREVQVLRLLVLGRSNREIAEKLGVIEGTVKSHLARLMRKAGVRNRTALMVRALEDGWTS